MTTFAEHVDATTIETLQARGSDKWSRFPGTIGAWIAEMDFGLAEPIETALRGMARDELYGYAPQSLLARVRHATSDWCTRRYGWTPDPDTVCPTSDVLHALGLALDHYTAPGAPMVTLTPCYMPFLTVPVAAGHPVVQVPMASDGDAWAIDDDALAAALTPGSLLVLANPFNPLGLVLTREQLTRIAEIVDAAGARVFADEIHAPLTFPGHTHVPYASVSETAARHSLTAMAASKAWNLAGLKCAQLILTNPDDLSLWRTVVERRRVEAANPGLVAAEAAYRDGLPWLTDALDYLDGNRHLAAEQIPARLPGATAPLIEGTYLQFIDCRALGIEGSPRDFFLEHARVALNDGATCGDAGTGFVRLNLATPRPILTEIIDRMATAYAEHGRA